MKHYPRIISAILAAAMIFSFVACAATDDITSDDTAVDTADETADETKPEIKDSLPNVDLDGYNFRMFILGDIHVPFVYSDEMDGSVVNDAVYSKILTVEERFNTDITLVETSAPADEVMAIKTEIMSGADTFDIVQAHDVNLANSTLEGLYVNIYEVPHLDFEKPWWPSKTLESMTIAGQSYLMLNNISLINLISTRVMYFNKTLFDNYGIDYPYQDVYDNNWTFERLLSLTGSAYSDLNGNSTVDDADMFGFVNPTWYYCWLEPFNVEPYKKDPSGALYYEFDLDKMQSLVEKFYSLLFGAGGYQVTSGDDGANKIFTEGRSLFRYEVLKAAAENFSLTDVIYGILPMPKYDENQDSYYAGSTDRPLAIPTTALPNIDTVGIIVEALNYEGYKQVFPAYYELALKSRYADQTDDAAMIDIIYENNIISFTYMYGNHQSPYSNMIGNLFNISSPSTDVASYAAKIEKAQSLYMDRLMKFYNEGT